MGNFLIQKLNFIFLSGHFSSLFIITYSFSHLANQVLYCQTYDFRLDEYSKTEKRGQTHLQKVAKSQFHTQESAFKHFLFSVKRKSNK